MKKDTQILVLICLGCFFLQINLFAQKVPLKVINGRVVYSDTIRTKLDRVEIGNKLREILANQDYMEGGKLSESNDSIKAFSMQITDHLEIEHGVFPPSIFSILMRYYLTMEYQNSCCVATITNISYIELDEYQKKKRLKDNSFDAIPGEMVLLDKQYKSVFYTNASEKIGKKTQDRIDEIFGIVRKAIKK